MSVSRGILGLVAICAVIALLSLLGVVWAFVSGLLYPHILLDGLLLVLICLMMGGIFTAMLFVIAKDYGLFGHLPFLHQRSAGALADPKDSPGQGK